MAVRDRAACTEQDVRDGNLYKLYLELGGTGQFADTGIQFKVPLETEVNPATGQLTAVSKELVQAPYNEVKIHLNGGPRAPLANPAVCGAATSTADFTPWSAPGRDPRRTIGGRRSGRAVLVVLRSGRVAPIRRRSRPASRRVR